MTLSLSITVKINLAHFLNPNQRFKDFAINRKRQLEELDGNLSFWAHRECLRSIGEVLISIALFMSKRSDSNLKLVHWGDFICSAHRRSVKNRAVALYRAFMFGIFSRNVWSLLEYFIFSFVRFDFPWPWKSSSWFRFAFSHFLFIFIYSFLFQLLLTRECVTINCSASNTNSNERTFNK